MPNPKRSDTATIDTTDWGFYVPDVAEQIRKLAESGVREFPFLNVDDLEQDLILWIAVRPEQQTTMGRIIQNCRNRIREWGQGAYSRAERETSYEAHFERED